MISSKVIAVDFDGTVVDHAYPDVGRDVPGAVEVLRELAENNKLILWTMRSGETLEHAQRWYAMNGIPLYGVNRNPTQDTWTASPKAYANLYIDDAAFGAPLITVAGFNRPCIDWSAVRAALL